MLSFTIAYLALLPALALASPLAASSTSVYQTSTSVSCSATGASTIYKTTTIHASVVSSTASTVYTTPSASTKTTTTTVTSTSVVPTSSGFVPVLDTTSTFPAKGASALTSQKTTLTVTCTNYQTIHTTVFYYPSQVTITASRPTITSTKTSVVTVPSYAACGANNLLSSDPATGAVIDDLIFNNGVGTMLTQQPATTPYDCCVKCITTPDCAYSYFNDNYSYYDGATDSIVYESQCVYVTYSTCNQTANQVSWIADGTDTSKWEKRRCFDRSSWNDAYPFADMTYTVSNGNCGFANRYVAPRCQQVKTGGYVCDLSCNGTQVPVPSPTTSLPACTATVS